MLRKETVAVYFEEFEVGQAFEVPPVTITKEQVVAFAKDYDPLPFHLDEDYAQTTRFEGLISSGVMSFMLVWSAFVKEHDLFGDELVAGRSNHMAWPQPAYPGDILYGKVTVERTERRNPYNGLVEISLSARNQDGQEVVCGGAQVVVKARTQGR